MVGGAAYSIVVPVRDEAENLRTTVPALLAATAGDGAEILYVCNACSDGSPDLIRALAGPQVRVLEIAEAGKTKALNAGDPIASAFPRFYLDADVVLRPGDLRRLAQPLRDGDADMVSPLLDLELSSASRIARHLQDLALPALCAPVGFPDLDRALAAWPGPVGSLARDPGRRHLHGGHGRTASPQDREVGDRSRQAARRFRRMGTNAGPVAAGATRAPAHRPAAAPPSGPAQGTVAPAREARHGARCRLLHRRPDARRSLQQGSEAENASHGCRGIGARARHSFLGVGKEQSCREKKCDGAGR